MALGDAGGDVGGDIGREVNPLEVATPVAVELPASEIAEFEVGIDAAEKRDRLDCEVLLRKRSRHLTDSSRVAKVARE